MSERSIRVNELILRELSHILRTRFREQTVAITLTEVSVSPDLRAGRVYYSVIGDERAKIKARSFFTKEYRTLRQLVAQKIVLKYFPKLNFVEDDSIARGNRILDLIGEIDAADAYAADDSAADGGDADAYLGADNHAEYEFDADDLEYARDMAQDEEALRSFKDDELEPFDEDNDVEFSGDLDLNEDFDEDDGFGKNSA